MQSQLLPPPLKVVGHISGKHGFQGNLNVQYLPGFSKAHIKKGSYLFVVINGKGVPFLISDISKLGDIISLTFIDSEAAAKSVIGCEIAIPTQELSESRKNKNPNQTATAKNNTDASIHSLLGLMGWELWETEVGKIGIIKKINELPQGFIFEVSGESESYLIPLVEEWISDIRESDQTLVMSLPEGLLGINSK